MSDAEPVLETTIKEEEEEEEDKIYGLNIKQQYVESSIDTVRGETKEECIERKQAYNTIKHTNKKHERIKKFRYAAIPCGDKYCSMCTISRRAKAHLRLKQARKSMQRECVEYRVEYNEERISLS